MALSSLRNLAFVSLALGGLGLCYCYSFFAGTAPITFHLVGKQSILAAVAFAGLCSLGLPVLLFLRNRLREQPNGPQSTDDLPARQSAPLLRALLCFPYVIVFLLAVMATKRFDIGWQDFDSTGIRLVAYSLGRLVLCCYGLVILYIVGAMAIQMFCPKGLPALGSTLAYVICCFFLGASLYGLTITLIGLCGFLSIWVGMVLALAALLAAPRFVNPLASQLVRKISTQLAAAPISKLVVYYLLVCCFLGAAGLLFVTRGLYPGPTSDTTDMYEHYLHYTRQVLQSGSLGPNELWYHFYLSKAQGPTLLLALWSDFFTSQLMGWCFLTAASLVVLDLTNTALKDRRWGLVCATLALCLFEGELFSHHMDLTAYLLFILWWCSRAFRAGTPAERLPLFTALIPTYYISLFLPAPASMLLCFLGLASCFALASKNSRGCAWSFGSLGLVCVAGVCTAFLINYASTGMGDALPGRFFWRYADQQRFLNVLGPSGMVFLLGEQSFFNHDEISRIFSLRWSISVFHINTFRIVLASIWLTACGLIVAGFWSHNRAANSRGGFGTHGALALLAILALPLMVIFRPQLVNWRVNEVLFLILVAGALVGLVLRSGWEVLLSVAFLAIALIFAQITHAPSIYRMFVFTIGISVFVLLALTKNVLSCLDRRGLMLSCEGFILVGLALAGLSQAFERDSSRIRRAASYAVGRLSVHGAMEAADEALGYPNEKLADWIEIRKSIGPWTRVFTFGHEPGPGYLLPGSGVISEPSYTLGSDFKGLVSGKPDEVKELLQGRNMDFFHINVADDLFSSLAFTQLFQAGVIPHYFRVVYHAGHSYVLTWRQDSWSSEPFDPVLLRVLDIRQTDVAAYCFSTSLEVDVAEMVDKLHGGYLKSFSGPGSLTGKDSKAISSSLELCLLNSLTKHMVDASKLADNTIFLNAAVHRVAAQVRAQYAEMAKLAGERSCQESVPAGSQRDVYLRELASLITTKIRSNVKDDLGRWVGPDLAVGLAKRYDKGLPSIYESRATFEAALHRFYGELHAPQKLTSIHPDA